MIDAVRRGLARFDTNNPSTRPPKNLLQRSEVSSRNVVDTALFLFNAAASGTPLALVTAGACVLAGVTKLITALSIGTVAGKQGMIATKIGVSGAALVAGGVTGLLPGVGHYVNASLAGLNAANAVNAFIPIDQVPSIADVGHE